MESNTLSMFVQLVKGGIFYEYYLSNDREIQLLDHKQMESFRIG